jgi:hypothetical protein
VTTSRPITGGVRRLSSGWSAVVLVALALAGLSLPLLHDTPAYDPYSWLIWGREIAHLHLDTKNAATSVKPLPMAIDTIFAFTGSAEPSVWLFIARAGVIFALGGALLRGWLAGVVALVGFAVAQELFSYLFMRGMTEPMAAGFLIAAVDAFLRRRHGWAVGCLIAVAYLRAEAWPILFVYLLWLAWSHGWVRRIAAAALGAFVPFSWFLIDFFGAHQFLRSAQSATLTQTGKPVTFAHPGLHALTESRPLATTAVIVVFLIGLVLAVRAWWRSGHSLAPTDLTPDGVVAVVAVAWVLIEVALSQGGFATGAPRYLLPADAIACVLCGLVVSDAVAWLRGRFTGRAVALVVPVVALAAFVAAVAGPAAGRGRDVRRGVAASHVDIKLTERLPTVIRQAGGAKAVEACGPLVTLNFQVPLLAWQLHLAPGRIRYPLETPTGTLFKQGGRPGIPSGFASDYHQLATVGGHGPAGWQVFQNCSK